MQAAKKHGRSKFDAGGPGSTVSTFTELPGKLSILSEVAVCLESFGQTQGALFCVSSSFGGHSAPIVLEGLLGQFSKLGLEFCTSVTAPACDCRGNPERKFKKLLIQFSDPQGSHHASSAMLLLWSMSWLMSSLCPHQAALDGYQLRCSQCLVQHIAPRYM